MFRKRYKRSLVMGLATIMILGGCGNEAADMESSESGGNVIANTTQTPVGTEVLIEEPVQLKVEDLADGEKYQIVYGCNENLVPQLMDAAIVEFNNTNPYYEVVIKGYDWQEGQQLLEMELATGRGPDLFDLNMVYVDKLVKKGLIEDLDTYLEDEQGMEREDLVEAVLRCNTMDGVLTCVPARFTLEVMLGKSSLIGDKTSWTVDEFLDCIEKNEGMQIANSVYTSYNSEVDNQYSIIKTVIHAGTSYFVDVENNKAVFDKEEFKNLLAMAKNYKAESFDYSTQENYLLQVQGNKLLLSQEGISAVEDYVLAGSVLGEETQYIGFPTYDGSASYGIRNYVACGMNSDSQVKEGAWAFLEFLVNYRFEESIFEYGFFTEEKGLEGQFAEAMEKKYVWDSNGEKALDEKGEPLEDVKWNICDNRGQIIAEAYAATQEEIDALRALMDGASYVYDSNSDSIYLIVQEEVFAYLEGDRSAEETIDIIQNRVQLYLDEAD